jgi:hypothetical protein
MSKYFGTPRDAGKSIVFKDTSRLMPPTFDPFSEEAYAASDDEEDMILARRKSNQEEPRRYVPPTGAEAKLVSRQQKEFDESIARDRDEIAANSNPELTGLKMNRNSMEVTARKSKKEPRYPSYPSNDSGDMVSVEKQKEGSEEPDFYTPRDLALTEEGSEEPDFYTPRDLALTEEGSEEPDFYTPRDLVLTGSFLDNVEEKVADIEGDNTEEPPAMEEDMEVAPSAEAEPTPENEEAMAQWRETLTADFKKIMGSSYDPNSSMDREKMKVLADFKRGNPNLSTNALALKIYRSGVL